jgi:hypothetical protein
MKNAETDDQCKYIHDVGWRARGRGLCGSTDFHSGAERGGPRGR